MPAIAEDNIYYQNIVRKQLLDAALKTLESIVAQMKLSCTNCSRHIKFEKLSNRERVKKTLNVKEIK